MPQAVVTQLVKAFGRDVLEEAPDELVAGHRLLAMAVSCPVLVGVGDGVVIDGQDSLIGDGDAEGIAGEIIEGGLLALSPRRDVDDPGDLPDMAWQIDIGAEFGEGVAEARTGKGGERRFGEEEGLPSGMPDGAVFGQSAAGD